MNKQQQQQQAETEWAADFDRRFDLNTCLYRWIPINDPSRPQDYKLRSVTWFDQCRVFTLRDLVHNWPSLSTLLNEAFIYKVAMPDWAEYNLAKTEVSLCWTDPDSLFRPFAVAIRTRTVDNFWLLVANRFDNTQEYIPKELLQDPQWRALYELARCDPDDDFLTQISHEKLTEFFGSYSFLDLSHLMQHLVKRQHGDEFSARWIEAAIKTDSSLIKYVMQPTYEQCVLAYGDREDNLKYCPAKYREQLKQERESRNWGLFSSRYRPH